WGTDPVMLQLDSLSTFKKALPFVDLLVTIQHAIRLARRLGFKYLWVDAMCITQDSEEDWKAEAAKMDNIYSRSTLTIAAVDALGKATKDPDELFTVRDPKRTKPKWRPLGHLDTRGWVTQEEILSRRILSFTTAGIFWSCTEWNCSEQHPDDYTLWKDRGYYLWMRVVIDYTRRRLTDESDRFIALKGIASPFSSRLQDKIVAGVWQGNSQQDLAWFTSHDPLRPKSYEAPSWSWSSV
ncbi:heterokaryon incompatibility protein-domain-containing protein, partial [Phaeosphaeriaceae sp. PMI808]